MFRLVLDIPYPIDSDCDYIFRPVLAILKDFDNDCGYMFRLL